MIQFSPREAPPPGQCGSRAVPDGDRKCRDPITAAVPPAKAGRINERNGTQVNGGV
ncbi:MAG TPA: hypothetical protein VFT39_11260 [Vicinamibacterales bacterium]|nr:hypothetical protein [Vicinamibacterales bacterium]